MEIINDWQLFFVHRKITVVLFPPLEHTDGSDIFSHQTNFHIIRVKISCNRCSHRILTSGILTTVLYLHPLIGLGLMHDKIDRPIVHSCVCCILVQLEADRMTFEYCISSHGPNTVALKISTNVMDYLWKIVTNTR